MAIPFPRGGGGIKEKIAKIRKRVSQVRDMVHGPLHIDPKLNIFGGRGGVYMSSLCVGC